MKGQNLVVTQGTWVENLRAHRFEVGMALTTLAFAVGQMADERFLSDSVFGRLVGPWNHIRSVIYLVAAVAIIVGIALDGRYVGGRQMWGTALEGWGLTALIFALAANVIVVYRLDGLRPGMVPIVVAWCLPSIDRLLALASMDRRMIPVAVPNKHRRRARAAR
jgi:hypothetical protein